MITRFVFIVVLLNNDLYFQWDPQGECRLSIMGTRSGFSLFDRVVSTRLMVLMIDPTLDMFSVW